MMAAAEEGAYLVVVTLWRAQKTATSTVKFRPWGIASTLWKGHKTSTVMTMMDQRCVLVLVLVRNKPHPLPRACNDHA